MTGSGQLVTVGDVRMVPAPPWVLTKMVTPRRYQEPAYFRRIAPAI